MYSLSSEGFENKVKLDCTNPIDYMYIFRIFGLGSINGILCLHEYENCSPIVLWNPATQSIKLIPPSSLESLSCLSWVLLRNLLLLMVLLLYMDLVMTYDSVMNAYKLICLVCFDIRGELRERF
jgi:hypothetical protein